MNWKIKISPAMLVAGIYFMMLFGAGYLAVLLILGYVLVCEDSAPLRRAAITATVIGVSFSLLSFFIGLLPNTISLFTDTIIGTFLDYNDKIDITGFTKIFDMIQGVVRYIRDISYLIFGFMALGNKFVRIGFIEKIIDKHAKPVEEKA